MQTSDNEVKKGGISVETEHIFPIIKKWLYSEKDIFLRELVSNAQDAITKLKRLHSLGQYEAGADENYRITVSLDKEAGTLTVEDNGIGMTEEELEKYICQIALSGALDFIQKYENADSGAQSGIIGHFGLGFYSAFMVSNKVEIETRSYTNAPAVHWICSDNGEYEIEAGTRDTHGTQIVLHISEDEKDYLEADKIRAMLNKYCSFMPVEIYFNDGHEEACECDTCKDEAQEHKHEEKPINDIHPLWTKPASECTDEEYKEFYHKVFGDMRDPLFWIHLNADYPLNFKGILYFPKIRTEYESIEGQVKLYYNQVFVADNIKEVIPEYLLMLKGVLDCPELPLNVSRSYLQTNTYVAKLSAHIVKKVADKLNGMKNNNRESYEKVWNDIKTFIEYACLRDKKFYERVKDAILFKQCDGKYVTLEEYLEAAKATNEGVVYYTTDKALQAQYISLFEAQGISVVCFDSPIDTQFASLLEQLRGSVKFIRVDAEIASSMKGEETIEAENELKALFVKASGNEKTEVRFEALKDSSVPALLNVSEESRRIEEMMKLYAVADQEDFNPLPSNASLVINTASPIVKKLPALISQAPEKASRYADYIYKLALLSHRRLSAEEMNAFLTESYAVLDEVSELPHS